MNMWYKTKKCAFALICATSVFSSVATADWSEGDAVPDLSGFELTGDVPAFEGKVTYVDFWASWCAPCKKAFPVIDALYQKHKDSGFQVLAVSVDSNAKAMQRFLDQSKPSFAIAHDPKQKLVADTGLEKMPTSYLVDQNGTIRYVHEGWGGNETAAELEMHILELLKEGK